MELSVRVLDIFFRRIEPEAFLRSLFENNRLPDRKFLKRCFVSKADDSLIGYSRNEHENVFEYFLRSCADHDSSVFYPPFSLLVDFGSSVLSMYDGNPACRFSEILNWRDCYLCLGQDTVICAWMASRSDKYRLPRSFAWPSVILSDDPDLNKITVNLAENHMHLYSGASNFSLTWCYLMNETADAFRSDCFPDSLLQSHSYRGDDDVVWSMRRRVLFASAIRFTLFQKLFCLLNEDCSVLENLRSFYYSSDDDRCLSAQMEINRLKTLFDLRFAQPDGRSVCLDYAFTPGLVNDYDKDFRLLASERYFLYSCFKASSSGFFNLDEQWIFYCYLLLKTQFRGEFVQVNQRTGFFNFHSYDDRKYRFWKENGVYWNEEYRQAINASFHEQSIISLECRISPAYSWENDLRDIYRIDKAKLFYDQGYGAVRQWHCNNFTVNLAHDERYYFVLHFPKEEDPVSDLPKPYCRHRQFRRKLRGMAISLANVLSNSNYYCERVLGIDACANEIFCRPEVFASAFRFLRDFPVDFYRRQSLTRKDPYLKITFHVGEDFLDIADGLRAIDEAIAFLNMRRGDRLGHVLALGVDPETHYDLKYREIILPKQDLLDNLVWVLFRSVELNVKIDPVLRSSMRAQAQLLLDEIYGHRVRFNSSLLDYYHSMILRGDSPVCYKNGCFSSCPQYSDPYDLFLTCDTPYLLNRLDNYRYDENVVSLYWMYHYSGDVKLAGAEKTTFKISQQYIILMDHMQKAMQNYVVSCGLAVECNPSSNVLIGTFGDYLNHPLLRFNHNGLPLDWNDPGMDVSINSDDPGVFDTSLTFEYELMAAALTKMQDSSGNRLCSDTEIREYLQRVIDMGRRQSFLKG